MARAPKLRLVPQAADMRKSFDGLSALVRDHGLDPAMWRPVLVFKQAEKPAKNSAPSWKRVDRVSMRPDNGSFAIDSPRVRISAGQLEDLVTGIEANGRRKGLSNTRQNAEDFKQGARTHRVSSFEVIRAALCLKFYCAKPLKQPSSYVF
jgi:hypothetical protein